MNRARSRIAESSSRNSNNSSDREEWQQSHLESTSNGRKGGQHVQNQARSISWPHSLKLWLKQIHLVDLRSSKTKNASENGNLKDLSSSIMDQISIGGAGRNPRNSSPLLWFIKFLVLSCFALFVLVTALGSGSSDPASLRGPSIYRGYRRLREQVIADFSEIGGLLTRGNVLGICTKEFEDFIPCYNLTENRILGFENGEEYDRHCGYSRTNQKCLVRPPKDYKIPLRWPTGRDVIWSNNVKITKDQLLSSGSLTKRLMLLEDNQISFRSEDALVVDGVEDYSHQIAGMMDLHNESEFIQSGVHTVLDIGCGFGSFGAHLFSKNLLTVCIAPYELYGSQVQLALERGLPAMLGSFISRQLPYPSLSFDMIHCARCGIEWEKKDGFFLIEVDRVLKPGGYFVWTSPLTYMRGALLKKENQAKWKFVEEFTEKLCWTLKSQQDETALWEKTADKGCYALRKQQGGEPPACNKVQVVETPYYEPLLPCIGGTESRRWIPIKNQTTWPARMMPTADLLSLHGIHAEEFNEDNKAWSSALKDYWSLLTPLIFSDHPKRPGEEDPLPPFNMVRNVMDMNARYGGLNAAMLEAGKTVWVMNVIPMSGQNTLPLILDRGFVGVLHDWCEAFPTYPRTYDMLHAAGLLSQQMDRNYKCGLMGLFLEMDRILRPEGWVVLRDEVQQIEEARAITGQLRWDARIVELEDDNEKRLLVCQKPFVRK